MSDDISLEDLASGSLAIVKLILSICSFKCARIVKLKWLYWIKKAKVYFSSQQNEFCDYLI